MMKLPCWLSAFCIHSSTRKDALSRRRYYLVCWCEAQFEAFSPEVITLNAGGNGFRLGGHVIMNDEDVVKVAAAAPDAKLFVTHLEGVNHNSVTREMVRKRAEVAGILDRVFIPEDGETVEDL